MQYDADPNKTIMWNRLNDNVFDGSIAGKGPLYQALWMYVLSRMKPDWEQGEFYLEMNPVVLAAVIGKVTEGEVRGVLGQFTEPDPDSRTEDEDGRRLVKEGQFLYRVVNGAKYNHLRAMERRREQNREAQRRYREGGKANGNEIDKSDKPGRKKGVGKAGAKARGLVRGGSGRVPQAGSGFLDGKGQPGQPGSNGSGGEARGVEGGVDAGVNLPPPDEGLVTEDQGREDEAL